MHTTTRESHKGKGWRIFGLAGIAVLGAATVVGIWGFLGRSEGAADPGPTRQIEAASQNNPPKKTSTARGQVPAALNDAGELGENIYDAAKMGDWKTADAKLRKLVQAARAIPSDGNASANLEGSLEKLEKSIPAKEKATTLIEANRITLEVANLTAKFDPAVPVEVVKLDYYGRELEIWAIAKNTPKLQEIARSIRQNWILVKPKIEAKGGANVAAAFDRLVVRIESAKAPNDYADLAAPILDEVDNLEKVFG